jgi:2-polyprenyl-3-methyl-5-hydroxy-6-metoxy-1,4-benzoquinol methylase/ribosomal protein S27E
MAQAEIRPEHLYASTLAASRRDLENFLLRHRDQFIQVACPACGSAEASFQFDKLGIRYESCSACSTLYVNPRPSHEILSQFYQNSETYAFWNQHVFPASEAVRRLKIFRPRAEKLISFCRKYNVAPDVLLEVGAGFGTFCQEVAAMGFFQRIIAVEPTPGLAATCRERGLEVVEDTIENALLPLDFFNVIASFEVIEHLFDPQSFLRSCHRRLMTNGLLLVTCPNCHGFDLQTLGPLSDTIDHEHLNYFNPASLGQLLTRCGFEPLELLTPGKLDADLVREKLATGQLDGAQHPFLKTLLIDHWEDAGADFQRFLAEHRLSSHLWAVARKP